MKVTTFFGGVAMALALVVTLAAVQPAKAREERTDGGDPDSYVLYYKTVCDWVYPPTGQTYQNVYEWQAWYDHGKVVKTYGMAEARAHARQLQAKGWKMVSSKDIVTGQGPTSGA